MSSTVISNVEEISAMHEDKDIDDLYCQLRSEFDFLRQVEKESEEKLKELREYRKEYRKTHPRKKTVSKKSL